MLKQLGNRMVHTAQHLSPIYLNHISQPCAGINFCSAIRTVNFSSKRVLGFWCPARRRVRYEEFDEDEDQEYGYNEDIAKLELYTQSSIGEALVVHAIVDEKEVDVLIFKGFSSCLNYTTPADPTRSILPARAVIKSIDRIRGPFDPSNIEYLQKDVTWDAFKQNLNSI